jgi:hypothetical protein
MNLRFNYTPTWFWALLLGIFIGNVGAATAGEPKFEAQLIWATNDEKPPSSDYKPVNEETRKKLDSLSMKWKNYFIVSRKDFETKNGESGKVQMSETSSITVKLLEDKKVEVVLYGKKDKECSRRSQPLKADEMLCFGGNVPENATAWLVTLKRLK